MNRERLNYYCIQNAPKFVLRWGFARQWSHCYTALLKRRQPVLSNVAPSDFRRLSRTTKIILKLSNFRILPLHKDNSVYPQGTLSGVQKYPKSRQKGYGKTMGLGRYPQQKLVNYPILKVSGWDLTRVRWTVFNRIRTEQERCSYLFHKWGMSDSPLC